MSAWKDLVSTSHSANVQVGGGSKQADTNSIEIDVSCGAGTDDGNSRVRVAATYSTGTGASDLLGDGNAHIVVSVHYQDGRSGAFAQTVNGAEVTWTMTDTPILAAGSSLALKIRMADFVTNTPPGRAQVSVRVDKLQFDEGEDKFVATQSATVDLEIEKIAETGQQPICHFLTADRDYILHAGSDPVTLSFFTTGCAEPVLTRNDQPVARHVGPGPTPPGCWVPYDPETGKDAPAPPGQDTIFGRLVDRPSISTTYRLDVMPEGGLAARAAAPTVSVRVVTPGWNRVAHPYGFPAQLFVAEDFEGGATERLYGIFVGRDGNAQLYSSETGIDDWKLEPGRVPKHMIYSPGAVFDGRLWLIGGSSISESSPGNEVYCYEGDGVDRDWQKVELTGEFPERAKHSVVAVPKRLKEKAGVGTRWTPSEIWVLGGYNNGTYFGDVLKISGTDGAYKIEQLTNQPQWKPRFGHAATALRPRAEEAVIATVILFGGETKEGVADDLYTTSDGKDWRKSNPVRPSPGAATGLTLIAAPHPDGGDTLLLAGTFMERPPNGAPANEAGDPTVIRSSMYENIDPPGLWHTREIGLGWQIADGRRFTMRGLVFKGFIFVWSVDPVLAKPGGNRPSPMINVFIPN